MFVLIPFSCVMSSKLPFSVPTCMVTLRGVCGAHIGVHSCRELLLTGSSGILLPLEKRTHGSQISEPWSKDIFRAKYVIPFQIVI